MISTNRRTLLLGGLGLGAAATVAGCSSSSSTSDTKTASQSAGPANLRVWFMDGSVSEEGQAWLKKTFESQNAGSKLTIEVQPWDGVLSKLQTSLASDSQTPDIVELGNTQTSTFSTVGALADITSLKADLGGDQLIKSFVEAGTIDGKTYAYPLYAGARGVYYRKDLFEKAGIAVPKSLDEFTDSLVKLQKANPAKTPGFSALYLAAGEIHAVESWFFSAGGDYAVQKDGKWQGALSSDTSQAALKQIKTLFSQAGVMALDSTQGLQNSWQNINSGKAAALLGVGYIEGKIDKALWSAGKVGVFPLPGRTGGPGHSFAGGSNVAVAARSKQQDAAAKAMKLIFSKDFQTFFAKQGSVPGNLSYADSIPGEFGKVAKGIVENSKLTPNNAQWGVLDGDNTLKDFWTQLAKGGDPVALAKTMDDKLTTVLNSK